MTPEALAEDLVPLAAELVGSVRDYGPEVVADVLARVPDGRHDALAVVLAAMVDPDARPSQLLAWTQLGPVPARRFEPRLFRAPEKSYRLVRVPCPDCGVLQSKKHLSRHRRQHVGEVA